MPARTTAPAMPMPVSPTPKSSAAKLTVWVNSVLMNADDIDAAASSPSTRELARVEPVGRRPPRASAMAWSVGRWVGAAPRRAIAQRTGSANSQANHGSDQR